MLFDKLFRNKQDSQTKKADIIDSVHKATIPASGEEKQPEKRKGSSKTANNVIVLWWISKKKKGYDKATNKFPKWFMTRYEMDFNQVMADYLRKGMLEENDNIVKISPKGENELDEFDYVIYVHENPQYDISIKDFKNSPNIHKVKNEDIAWGIFNSRIIEYTQKAMWSSLKENFGNMADLLIKEEKYDQALDFIFAAAYIETSGMRDDNELTPIMAEFTKRGWKKNYLPNGMPDIFLLEITSFYVTIPFRTIQEKLNLSWEEVKRKFINSPQVKMLEQTLPFKYFDKPQSFEIFKQAVEANGKGIFKLADCRKKLKWNTPDEKSKNYFYASVENRTSRAMRK